MRIAITQRQLVSPSGLESGDGISRNWFRWLRTVIPEVVVFPIPNDRPMLPAWWVQVNPQAIILTGGESFGTNPERDSLETAILDEHSGELPILGVCRGAQVINLWAGGGLTYGHHHDHAGTTHEIVFAPSGGSEFPVKGACFLVNSFHRNIIKEGDLAPTLSPRAHHEDGSVEAYESAEMLLMGVMWHPEREPELDNFLGTWISSHLLSGVSS